MARAPRTQRDQVMMAIGFVALVLAGAYWYFVYDPKNANVEKLATHVDSLETAVQRVKAQLAKGTTEQVRAQIRGDSENLALLRTLVPAGNEVPALIEQVSNAARRAKIDIGRLEPEPVIEGDVFDTYRYKLTMYGTYHTLARVLGNIGSLNRVVAPINLQLIMPTTAQKSPPGGQTLQGNFEIQTYVARTAPARLKPAERPPAKAGAKTEGEK